MAEVGLKVDRDVLGYEPSPELKLMEASFARKHEEETAAPVQAFAQSLQQPSPENNIKAADALKKLSGVDQPQLMNAFYSVLRGNLRDVGIALTGGAPVPTQAYDSSGKEWIKVFNERRTEQNPNGEIRGYIDPSTGKKYTPDEIQALKVGPIMSVKEIPVQQQNFFAAQGITAKAAAQEQINSWLKNQKVAQAANANAPFLVDTANALEKELSDPNVIKMSVSGPGRELYAGINEMRTGNTSAISKSAETMKRFMKGDKKTNEVNDALKQGGGLNLGLQYHEGKGWTKSDGTVATEDDINQAASNAKSSMSSENAITARRDNLLQRAQLAAANGELKDIDRIQRIINLKYQQDIAIQDIENAGGIKIARPSLPHEVGDSFALLGVKNKLAKQYGELASVYSQTVADTMAQNPNSTPAIGTVEALLKNNPYVRQNREKTRADIERYIGEVEPMLSKIKGETTAIQQPSAEMTSTGGGIPRSVAPAPVELGVPAGAKKPKAEAAAPSPGSKIESMAEIRARLKQQRSQ